MGQKTHPIGLRVGIYQKWATSWYAQTKSNAPRQLSFHGQHHQAQGVITSRGGSFLSTWENSWTGLLSRYAYTKFTRTRQILLLTVYPYKASGGHRFFFFFYIKLTGRRARSRRL